MAQLVCCLLQSDGICSYLQFDNCRFNLINIWQTIKTVTWPPQGNRFVYVLSYLTFEICVYLIYNLDI